MNGSQVAYEFTMQATSWDSLIKTQVDCRQLVPLSANVLGDTTYQIPAGAIAQALPVPSPNPVGILILLVWGGPISLQLNNNTTTPKTVLNLYVVDGEADITAVLVSNPGSSPVNVRAIMAAR